MALYKKLTPVRVEPTGETAKGRITLPFLKLDIEEKETNSALKNR